MKKIITLVALALLVSSNIYSQKTKKKNKKDEEQTTDANIIQKLEFDGEGIKKFEVIPLDSLGVLVYKETKEENTFTLYDTDFKKKNMITFDEAGNKSSLLTYRTVGTKVYFIFDDRSTVGAYGVNSRLQKCQIIQYDVLTKKKKSLEYKFEKIIMAGEFLADENTVLLTGSTSVSQMNAILRTCATCAGLGIPIIFGVMRPPVQPALALYDFKNSSVTTDYISYPDTKKQLAAVISADLENHEAYLLIKHRIKKKLNKVYLREAKVKSGINYGKELELDVETDKEFYNAKINLIDEEGKEKLICGNFGKPSPFGTSVVSTKGIYLSKLKGDKQTFTKYYNWNELVDLCSKGDKKVSLYTDRKNNCPEQALFHDVIIYGDDYLMVMETYYPVYHTETTTTWVNGKPQTSTRVVFDGFRFDMCWLLCFNVAGKLLWGDEFGLPYNTLTFHPQKLVMEGTNNGNLTLTYYNGKQIATTTLDSDKNRLTKTEKIENKSDNKKNYQTSRIRYWYGPNFIVYGKRKGEDKKSKNNYYINVIKVGETYTED